MENAAILSAMIMGMGPVGAMRKAANRTGLKLDDLDVIELNEAVHALQRRVGGRGAASLCIGGGMGTAMVIEVA